MPSERKFLPFLTTNSQTLFRRKRISREMWSGMRGNESNARFFFSFFFFFKIDRNGEPFFCGHIAQLTRNNSVHFGRSVFLTLSVFSVLVLGNGATINEHVACMCTTSPVYFSPCKRLDNRSTRYRFTGIVKFRGGLFYIEISAWTDVAGKPSWKKMTSWNFE